MAIILTVHATIMPSPNYYGTPAQASTWQWAPNYYSCGYAGGPHIVGWVGGDREDEGSG